MKISTITCDMCGSTSVNGYYTTKDIINTGNNHDILTQLKIGGFDLNTPHLVEDLCLECITTIRQNIKQAIISTINDAFTSKE